MEKRKNKTNVRWNTGLKKIKQELDDNNYNRITKVIRDNINCHWHGFLIDNKIVYRNELGYYKWNDKIPITYKLFEKFRVYLINSKTIHKRSYSKIEQQPTLFDNFKTKNIKVEFKDKQQQELGLIRRFLKWIY